MELKWKPILQWPGERTKQPKRSQFSADYSKTLELIDDELRHLSARAVVLQADCDASEIRNDGRLRAHAKLRSQGIIISLDSKHGPLSWACDRYDRWADNLRAIALTMQSLRAVSRYGVVREAEQYKGFKALPGPAGESGSSTARQAATWLWELLAKAGRTDTTPAKILNEVESYEMARRAARATAHPDRHNGDRTEWNQLEVSVGILDKHHKLA